MLFQNVAQGVSVFFEMIIYYTYYYTEDILVSHTALNLSQVLPWGLLDCVTAAHPESLNRLLFFSFGDRVQF